MKNRLRVLVAIGCMTAATTAKAGMYITGSLSYQTTNAPFQYSLSEYGNASIDFDIGRYVRLGYTYGVELQNTSGWRDPNDEDNNPADPGYCKVTCGGTFTNTKVIENSIGLTIILYEGQVFMPFLLGGVMEKQMTTTQRDYDIHGNLVTTSITSPPTPEPYGGGGIGIRLNKDFTLKFSYQVSPSVSQEPNEDPKHTWDRRSSAGLTYQFL